MKSTQKRAITKAIKLLKKLFNRKGKIVVTCSSLWDAHEREYNQIEVAARFLRLKGYSIELLISYQDPRCPSYLFGYLRYHRHVKIIKN